MQYKKTTKPSPEKYVYYSEVMSQIKTGDLLCWRVNRVHSFFTFLLYLYQRFFHATYAHVAVALCLGGRVFAVEATYPAVRIMPLHALSNFYLYSLDRVERESDATALLRHLGKRYSLLDMLKNMLGINSSRDDFYCSELAYTFYEDIGHFTRVVDEFDEDIVTPDMLVKKIMEQSNASLQYVRIDKGNLNAQ